MNELVATIDDLEQIANNVFPDFYEVPDDGKVWDRCSRCHILPRTWKFNNGMSATCFCTPKDETNPVRVESPVSHYRRTGGKGYRGYDELRECWNKYARTGKPQNELPEGAH